MIGLLQREAAFQAVTAVSAAGAGVCSVLSGLGLIQALACDPMSMTILVFSLSVVVPPGLSILFLRETPTPAQLAGLILIMAVLILVNGKKNTDQQKGDGRWLALALLSAASSGVSTFLSKFHQTVLPGQEELPYAFICYLVGSVFSLMLLPVLSRLEGKSEKPPYAFRLKGFFLLAAGTALTLGGAQMCNLYNASRLPAIVLFPVVQLGTLMVTVVYSLLMLKEKPTFRLHMGLAMSMGAILCMNF